MIIQSKYHILKVFVSIFAIITLLASCAKKDPGSFSISEKQYLLFNQIDAKGDPGIYGDVFFTKSGDQTKVRVFYYSEELFKAARPLAIFKGDVLGNSSEKILDIPAITGQRSSYTEVMWNMPFEQAINQSCYLKMYRNPKQDTVLAVADLGPNGFRGIEWNKDYAIMPYNGATTPSGKLTLWQRRNESYLLKVALDTMEVGKQYIVNISNGDVGTTATPTWLQVGEIPNTTPDKKYKAINVSTNAAGVKLSKEILSSADAHIEVRKMPDNVIVAQGAFGKYKP